MKYDCILKRYDKGVILNLEEKRWAIFKNICSFWVGVSICFFRETQAEVFAVYDEVY